MRLALAKLLLIKPNLLLLDEPTNHLDLEARNWLEQYLKDYPFAFVLVSHDRYFLDVTVNKILEIWNRRAYFYTGNYDRYLTQKAERRAQLEAACRNQQEQDSSPRSLHQSLPLHRPPRPGRCRAESRSWRRSKESRCRPRRSPSTSHFLNLRRAGAWWRSFAASPKAMAPSEYFKA